MKVPTSQCHMPCAHPEPCEYRFVNSVALADSNLFQIFFKPEDRGTCVHVSRGECKTNCSIQPYRLSRTSIKKEASQHAFYDGNGRTGRLAMNYLLVLHGYPLIIIHEEDRKEYNAGLEAWDTRQDLTLLREFLKWQTEKTWEKQTVRAERQQG